jgi:pimeloyl-ACP methyl ester carboxylesterase
MAEELYSVLRPHMEGQGQLHLAGHSLGGSLATLVALTAHLRLGGSTSASAASLNDRQQQQQQQLSPQGQQQQQQQQQRRRLQVTCTTFGSPPVLAMSQGEGEDGRSILQAARMPPGAVRNYVLQVRMSAAKTGVVSCTGSAVQCW